MGFIIDPQDCAIILIISLPEKNKKVNCCSVLTRFNDFLQSKYKCNLPVGFKLCTACRNATLATMQSSDVVEHYVEYEEEPDSELDVDYNSNYSSVSKNSCNATLSSVHEEISPIKFQLRTPVESARAATVKKLKRKLSQCVTASTKYICDALAPGQTEALKKMLCNDNNQNSEKVIPEELSSLVDSYKSAPSQQVRFLILSLVPSKFLKTNCMEFFGCSKWMIEQAGKINLSLALELLQPKKHSHETGSTCLKLSILLTF